MPSWPREFDGLAAGSNAMLSIHHIGKAFAGRQVLADFSLTVPSGERCCLLAPSGAGKSTLLRVLAGLELPDAGVVTLDGKPISACRTNMGWIPQADAVFPFLSTRDNLLFPFRLAVRRRRSERDAIPEVERMLDLLGLRDQSDLWASRLSGGERQRVVLGRALLARPRLALCDEPLSALDELTRQVLRELLLELHAQYHPMLLFVTHSVEEACFLGTQVVVCSGPPLQIRHVREIKDGQPRDWNWLQSEPVLRLRQEIGQVLWQIAREATPAKHSVKGGLYADC